LEAKNRVFLNVGERMPKFKIVDASEPLENVFENVKKYIFEYYNSQ
jgi:thymidylate kinase